jgi:hypothetical protein
MWKSMFAAAVAAAVLVGACATMPAFAATDQSDAAAKKPLTPSQIAFRERQKKCAAEWREAKDANKIPDGMKWPKFWSACNTRLKAQTH